MTNKHDDDPVVVEDRKPAPKAIHMRWSKVLNKWVPTDVVDDDCIVYLRAGS